MDAQSPSHSTPPKHFIPTPFAYHETLELDIQTLTNEGRGIGRHNDWAVMVPFVIPGERVRVRIFRNHKNYSEADLVEVLTPSPQRVQPRCPTLRRVSVSTHNLRGAVAVETTTCRRLPGTHRENTYGSPTRGCVGENLRLSHQIDAAL